MGHHAIRGHLRRLGSALEELHEACLCQHLPSDLDGLPSLLEACLMMIGHVGDEAHAQKPEWQGMLSLLCGDSQADCAQSLGQKMNASLLSTSSTMTPKSSAPPS